MKEIFKSIGFKDYSVSNLGNIKNEKTGNIRKPFLSSSGYYQVNLGIDDNGKQYAPMVHVLVAKAFIPNPNNLPIVNHIDENKKNCVVSNLEWCDYMYNINYGNANTKKSHGLMGNQNAKGKRKKKGTSVRYIYLYNGKEYSIKEIMKELKCSKSKITESFRSNIGLVRTGELKRKIKPSKEEEEALKIGISSGVFLPRELTEDEINDLNNIFENKGE